MVMCVLWEMSKGAGGLDLYEVRDGTRQHGESKIGGANGIFREWQQRSNSFNSCSRPFMSPVPRTWPPQP